MVGKNFIQNIEAVGAEKLRVKRKPFRLNKSRKLFLFIGMLLLAENLLAQDLHVMTFNIRYNTPADSLNAWLYRRDNVATQILFHDVHLLGVQEALHGQMEDLAARLPRFKYIGVGRDDGKQKGEYSGIFYDTTKLEPLQTATFWLSLTPEVPGSKSWDAAITRIVTWAKFRDRRNRRIFYAFNTHFDHMGKKARRQSATLLLQKVAAIAGKTRAVITGDFNAMPTDEPIQVLTAANDPLRLTNAKAVSATPHYGPAGTFNGFGPKERDNEPIDYIFLKGSWKVKKHATLSQTWNGRFASDHFAVMAVLQ
jgi:endonuclease/exonuclease/phosphatase family metal-dependent hydrolase